MNHSYRVVFNESTNTYTAVAEIAKARGKKSKSSKAAAVVAVSLSLGFAPNAFADQTTVEGTKNLVEASGAAVYGNYNAVAGIGTQMIVVGNSNDVGGKANARSTTETAGGYEIDPSAGLTETDASETSNSRNTVVIGNVNTVANSASAVVLGRGITMTNADRAISMGLRSSVTQADAIALGSYAQAAATSSLALGSNARVEILTGKSSDRATAIGASALAQAQDAIAIGTNTQTGSVHGTVVVGNNAKADDINAASTGPSITWYNNPYNKLPNGLTVGTGSIVVATDASGQNAITAAPVAIGENSYAQGGSVVIGDSAQALREVGDATTARRSLGVAIGANARSHGGAVAIGSSSYTEGINAIAVGRQAAAVKSAGIAIGTSSAAVERGTIAVGQSATAKGERSIAIGVSESDE